MEIYTEVAKLGRLTDAHRRELKKKRGFTDETIDTLGFFSAGPQLKKAIESLSEKYGIETMVSAGLYDAKKSPPEVAFQWTNETLQDGKAAIVIPFYDGDDLVYLRVHKFGPSNVPVQLYLPAKEMPGGRIILTESEFKATAAHQLGFPVIGMPGIWSFTKTRWAELRKRCKGAGVTNITICFDNENKSDASLPQFKPDPMKRYDAEYTAFLLATLFVRADIPARIARLPDAWRVNGKADIDGALAAGRTRPDFEAVFAAALGPEHYLNGLPEEARHVVKTKVSAFHTKTRLSINHNCYWWSTTDRDGQQKTIKVSNFILEIQATFSDADGCRRMMHFIDETGKASPPVVVEANQMPSAARFREWCIAHGNYLWMGPDSSLMALWELLFRKHGDRVIFRPDHVGWVKHGDIWLFSNCAITQDGTLLKPDKDGIIYHPTSKQGYKALNPVGDRAGATQDRLPKICLSGGIKLGELADKLNDNFGSYAPAMGLGWIIGCIYSADLWHLYNSYPFLFLFGKREGGKTTLARYLVAVTGIETEGENINEATQNGIARSMSYYSSLPYWLEEFRNDQNTRRKEGYLRAAYNRTSAAKGIKAEFGVRALVCRSGLLISGEDPPSDAGLLSRCVIVTVDEKVRRGNHYTWLQANWTGFSADFIRLVADRKANVAKIEKQSRQLHKHLFDEGISDRQASNWAMPIACYWVLVAEDQEFVRWACSEAHLSHERSEEAAGAMPFLDDLAVMARNGQLNKPSSQDADWRVEANHLYVRFGDAYNKWLADLRKRGGREWQRSSVEHYLKDVPGFCGKVHFRIPIDASTVRCLKFDLEAENLPEAVEVIADVGR